MAHVRPAGRLSGLEPNRNATIVDAGDETIRGEKPLYPAPIEGRLPVQDLHPKLPAPAPRHVNRTEPPPTELLGQHERANLFPGRKVLVTRGADESDGGYVRIDVRLRSDDRIAQSLDGVGLEAPVGQRTRERRCRRDSADSFRIESEKIGAE